MEILETLTQVFCFPKSRIYDGPQGTCYKQKRNAANKKETLQIKNENCNLKMYAANNRNAANKKRTLQIKENIMRAHSVKGTG